MNNLITIPNVTFALGFLAMIFGVYNYFRKPQEDLDKRQAVSEKEVDSKAALLAQQVQWQKERTDKRFEEMATTLKDSTAMAQNHIHTIDVKIDSWVETSNSWHVQMSNQMARLETIIDERIPKKVV